MANSDYTERGLVLTLCPVATVAGAITPLQTSVTISAFSTPDGEPIRIGSAAMLCDDEGTEEIVEIVALAGSTLTIARGCCDTIPQAHSAGSSIWFFDDYLAADQIEYGGADTIGAKPLPKTTSGGPVAIEASPPTEITFGFRFAKPYPPALVEINGNPWFSDPQMEDSVLEELLLTWVHRNRVTQADVLVDHLEGSVTPEVGTTYTLRLHRASDDSLVRTIGGLVTPSFLYSIANAQDDYGYSASAIDCYMMLSSVRDTFESRAAYRIDFSFIPFLILGISFYYEGTTTEVRSGIDVRTNGMALYKEMTTFAIPTPNTILAADSDGVVFRLNTSASGWKNYPLDGSTFDAMAFNPGVQFESATGQVIAFLEGAGILRRVSWTGDGLGPRDLAHSLGIAPVIALVKSEESEDWWMYSAEAGADEVRRFPSLSGTAFATVANVFPALSTNTLFKIGSDLNELDVEYTAFLFADSGDDAHSGTYTGNGSASGPSVSIPWEADVLLIFALDGTSNIFVRVAAIDDDPNGATHWFMDNLGTSPEYGALLTVDSSGFDITSSDAAVNALGTTYQFWARRKV